MNNNTNQKSPSPSRERDEVRLELGRMNTLKVLRQVEHGYYLDGGPELGDILLPNGEIRGTAPLLPNGETRDDTDQKSPSPFRERDGVRMVSVFLYLDQEERLVATMQRPLAMVGDFAWLEVAWVNNFGAFLNWGLQKDLFVPFREQKMKMQKGQRYIVHVHLDEDSYRIMASAKVDRYLSDEQPPYRVGDPVEVLIWQKTDLGFKAIADNKFAALIYDDQVFRPLHTGDRLTAYVSQVREDGKLDLMLQRPGQAAVEDFSTVLLRHLETNGGRTVLCDKSPAEEIYAVFGVSKKVFKKAVGDLYKRRLITITPEGLWLNKDAQK